jgi:light-regulated signal transduction histidine kinase (bacteriophytochrome)
MPDPKVENHEGRVRELTEELEALSYSIAHDLRAPLRTVVGFSQILFRNYSDRFDPEGRELLQMVHDGARTLNDMIEAMLEYSRIERRVMTFSELNMEQLADEQFAVCRSKAFDRKVRFVRTGLAGATGDREMVRQVLTRLFDNALKFTREREEAVIEIGCLADDGEIRYQIKDNGIGFDPACSDRLFRMFQRLHPAGQYEGIGSGLAVTRRICERHGGRIWAESEPGAGAVFNFILG